MIPSAFAKDDCLTGAEALARARAGYERRRAGYEPRVVVPPPTPSPPPVRMRKPAPPPPPPPAEAVAVPAPAEDLPPPPAPAISAISAAAAGYFHLTYVDFMSVRREYPLPLARQIVMYLAATMTPRSLPEIGRRLGRDHTTVLHGRRRVEGLLAMGDAVTVAAVTAIKTFLATGVKDFPAPPPLSRPGKWWRHSEIKTLKSMRDNGADPKEMALALGRSNEAVRCRLRLLERAEAP